MGSTKIISDFIVETKGHCFLCLKRILPEIKLEPELPRNLPSSTLYPLQCLSRYLKLEMSKVFCGDGPIPPHLLAKVHRSILKVELCEDCVVINYNFSELFRQLEYLKMKATSWLKDILLKLEEGEGTQRTEEFQALAEQESLGIEKLNLVEALRAETMANCSKKLRKSLPRVRVHKLKTPIGKYRNIEGVCNVESSPSPIPDDSDANDNDDPDYDANYDTDHSAVSSAASEPEDPPNLQNVPVKLEPDETEQLEEGMSDNDQPPPTTLISKTKRPPKTKNYLKTSAGKFKCKKCLKTFEVLSGFRRHYTCTHLNVKYNCSICNKNFNRLPDYKSHQKKEHRGKGTPVLHPDAKNYQNQPGNNYTKTSTGAIMCTKCSKQFKRYAMFYQHYLVEHLDIRYGCSICEKQFRGRSAYMYHRAIKHDGVGYAVRNTIDPANVPKASIKLEKIESGEIGDEEADDEKIPTLPDSDPKTKMAGEKSQQFIKTRAGKFKCVQCSRLLGTRRGFTQHYQMEHLKIRYSCSICDKEFKVVTCYRIHRGRDHKGLGFMKTHGRPEKETKVHGQLKKYIIVVDPLQTGAGEEEAESNNYGYNAESGKHRCNTCLKEFKWKVSLNQHFRNVHRQVKFKCGLCTKSYGLRGALRYHLKTSHNDIFSYKCEHCPRSFLTSIQRDSHANKCPGKDDHATSAEVPTTSILETETGSFKCNICDKEFRTAGSCRLHHFHQHKKRKCNYCEEEFLDREEQRRHMDTTHLKCEHCGKTLESRSKLQDHINGIHLKVKENVCDQCGSSFVKKTQLTKHVLSVHLKSAKEHICDKCGRGFVSRKGLSVHMKKIHP